jgi:hypothetical protein
VIPTLDTQTLHATAKTIQRHLREPPRKRAYQNPTW